MDKSSHLPPSSAADGAQHSDIPTLVAATNEVRSFNGNAIATVTAHTARVNRRSGATVAPIVNDSNSLAIPCVAPRFTLSWSNLAFSPLSNKQAGKRKMLFQNVSGRAGAGELTAVMGPSGSGKTTLLDVLLDRVQSGTTDGVIEVNGWKRTTRLFRAIARYVAQDDALLGSFTVRETLVMAAKLSVPSKTKNATIHARVETVLDEMGLRSCANTWVGDIFRKGISGGQKRRLSMAIELLSNPSILLLDEPTSGLDSASTYNTMKLIQKLCREERKTVICTIHQPSPLVYEMFSNIVILSGGETPAKYFVGLVNADFEGHGDISALVHAYAQSQIAASVTQQIFTDRIGVHLTKSLQLLATPSPWRQFWVLLHRNALNNLRNPGIFWLRFALNMILATMVGTMYVSTNNKISDADISVLLFGNHAFIVTLAVAAVPFFIGDRAISLRERLNSSLHVGSFVTASFLAAIPGILVVATTCSCLLVFLVGLRYFWYFLLNMFLSLLVSESLMRVIGAASPHAIIGLSVGASVFGVFMVCEGFLIPRHAVPKYWLWGYYLAFYTYAYETFMFKQFMPEDHDASIPAILVHMRMTDVRPERNMAILLAYSLALETLLATILYFVHTGRR